MFCDEEKKISRTIPWVLVATFALLPLSAKVANVTALLVFVLWLAEGGLKEKLAEIRSNPVAFIPIVYFLLLCLGLLWTSDLDWGLHVIKKSRRILLIPVFLSIAGRNPQIFCRGMVAFLASTALTALVSLAMACQLIPLFGHATPGDPSPFVYHVSYAPELAWAAYIAFAAVLFDPKFSTRPKGERLVGQRQDSNGTKWSGKRWKISAGLAGILILVCLFMNIGVAGYAAAFMLLGLLVLQWKKNILWPALAVILLAGSAYWLSPSVHQRVDQNVQEIRNVLDGTAMLEDVTEGAVENNSCGPRLVFWGNTLQVIKQHPVFGVGTGDFPAEYEKVRLQRTPNHWEGVNNPHNMYLMVWAQSGLVGLIVFLGIFAALFAKSIRRSGWEAKMTVGLICFMLFIMMSDAYMQLSNTSLLFALFASVSSIEIRAKE